MHHHLKTIWKFRHFLNALVRLDLRLRYRRSILGVGWSLLNPIAMTVVFAVVFTQLLGGGDIASYVPHLLVGMSLFGFFRESAIQGCKALIGNESYIRQSPLPYGIYPLRTVLGQAIHSAIALAAAVAVTVVMKQSAAPLLALPAVLPGLVLAFVFAWAIATIFAFANVYFQDTQHLLEVAAQILFFLTPIMYKREDVLDKPGAGLSWVADLNPINLYLELIRTPLVGGGWPPADLYLAGLAVTGGAAALAVGTVAWLQKRVIFHL